MGALVTLLWVLLGLLAAIVLLAALLLLAWLRVDGRVSGRLDVERFGEASAYGRVRLAPLAAVVDTTEGVITVRLLGIRVFQKPLAELGSDRGERGRADAEGVKQERRPAKADGRFRLSDGSAVWRFYRRQLRYLARRTHLERFDADLRVATPDPALTGMLYGASCAVVYPLRARWPQAALAVEADFLDTAPALRLALAMRVRIATLAVVAFRSYRFHRSRARKSPRTAHARKERS